MAELSVLPSVMMRSMMRSGLSGIGIEESAGGPEGNPMHFCTLCTVCVMIFAIFSYGIYYAFIKDKAPGRVDAGNLRIGSNFNMLRLHFNCHQSIKSACLIAFRSEKTTTAISHETSTKEEPPLLCSFDGGNEYDYPVHMCSYIIFLSAVVDKGTLTVVPLPGTSQRFDQFNATTKQGGVKKLLSFRYDDVTTLTSEELDKAFTATRDTVFHGIDVRYTQGEAQWLTILSQYRKRTTEGAMFSAFKHGLSLGFNVLLAEIRQLADKNGYLIHMVFDKPNKVELRASRATMAHMLWTCAVTLDPTDVLPPHLARAMGKEDLDSQRRAVQFALEALQRQQS